MIRAVLFDLDDTLFDHASCARAALRHVHAGYGCFNGVEFEELARRHADTLEELHVEVVAGRIGLDDARVERFRRLCASAGTDVDGVLASEAAAAYRQKYLEERREVEGAAALLAAVRARAKVGIVSNNLLDEQREKLKYCGLDRYIDALVVSEVVGVSKPDRRIFAAALAELNTAPEDAVMVGDSWTADIAGAIAAGIRAVWFNPRSVAMPEPRADVSVIRTLGPAADTLAAIFGTTTERETTRPR